MVIVYRGDNETRIGGIFAISACEILIALSSRVFPIPVSLLRD